MAAVSNSEIARILYEIGEYLEMQKVQFKPRAYEKAAQAIEELNVGIADLYKKGGIKALEEIPGVGASIAGKLAELIKTGRLKYYDRLKKKAPVQLSTLTRVTGLGPNKIKVLYQKLKIRNLEDLEKAARRGKISRLPGFGEKSEQNILRGIEFVKGAGERFVLGFVLPDILAVLDRLKKLKEVKKVELAGSARRWKETIGDADILIVSENPKPVMDYFVSMPSVSMVIARGETKSSVRLRSGLNMDLRVVPEESYGAALAYFTGSKDHNVKLRQIAIKKGLTLNEYGLFKGKAARKGKMVAGRTEEEVYNALGLDYIEPEMREMRGEIELAQKSKLPKLIGYGDLKGDLQIQTNWTDGAASIEVMAEAVMKRGLEYIAITDHTKRLAMAHGLDEKRILKQMKEIDGLNRKFEMKNLKFKILKGTECDILKDGSLDLPDDVLSKLDVVGASVHSYFNLPEKEQTARIIKAMRNKHVDIIFHPTGRLIQRRKPYDVDMGAIIRAAKETGTILEINGSPDRLDLRDENVKKCAEEGVKMVIDSDAHSPSQLGYTGYGIAHARRGWARKNDIINAWPVEKMLGFLK